MKHFFCTAVVLFLIIGGLVLTGCNEQDRRGIAQLLGGLAGSLSQSPLLQRDVPFHKRFQWNAEDFFDDPQVIALCRAIEAQDLQEIDRLIADGADVNALGKDNMTPLLWAFPTQNLAVLTKILEAGADPNVHITSDFGGDFGSVRMGGMTIRTGMSVLEMAAQTSYKGYFEAVMKHCGNPNLVSKVAGVPNTPLHSINRIEHAKLLLDAGADINAVSWNGTPVTVAFLREKYDLVFFLLEAGADWDIVPGTFEFVARDGHHFTRTPPILLQQVVRIEEHRNKTGQTCESFDKLVLLLQEKGADFDKIREEEERERQK
jgi:ankyrin repeat protein